MRQKTKKAVAVNTAQRNKLFGQHRFLGTSLIAGLLVLILFGIYKLNSYNEQFSKNNYETLSRTSRSILTEVSNKEVSESKTCTKTTTSVYDQARLYCSIKMVSYMSYTSAPQATQAARTYEAAIARNFPERFSDFSNFYTQTENGSSNIRVALPETYPDAQCNFRIDAGERAKTVSRSFPERSENNLIALSFDCITLAKDDYYPLVNR